MVLAEIGECAVNDNVSEYIQVITVTGSKAEAEMLSQELVDKRLAACAQILGPIVSVYRWKGKVENATEWLCFIKSRADLYDELESKIREAHTYEVPEILALPIEKGSKSYLEWMERSLKKCRTVEPRLDET